MKKITNHTIYEIWNEHTCETVFVDHKPTNLEIAEICKKESWDHHQWSLRIEKLKPLYGN